MFAISNQNQATQDHRLQTERHQAFRARIAANSQTIEMLEQQWAGHNALDHAFRVRIVEWLNQYQHTLNLSNLGLTQLPDIFSALKNVSMLNLSGNRLTEIPLALHAMQSLTHLDLSNNAIHDLPEDFWDNKANLQALDLRNNQLAELPGPRPEMLSFQLTRHSEANMFEGLPLEKHPRIEILHAGGNRLDTLPETMNFFACMRQCHLGNNKISSFPAAVFDMHELNYLDLSGNPLSTLPYYIGTPTHCHSKPQRTLVIDQDVLFQLRRSEINNCPMTIAAAKSA